MTERNLQLLKFMAASLLIVPIAFGQITLTTAQIAKKVSPSVVVIQGKTESGEVLGSGFIVSKDGKIVTNLHVIRDMKTASVQLANREVFDSVSVLAVDEQRDLALIKVAGVNLTTLALGNSDTLSVGEPVVVVGSPLGLDATVTAGILSAIRDSGEGYKLLQTDAAVNHGNSGGPLVAGNGLAVGVVSSVLRSDAAQGLNFAIPINYVRGLLTSLHNPMTLPEMRRSLTKSTSLFSQSNAQEGGPSIKETLEWLKETIPLAQVRWANLPSCGFHRPDREATYASQVVAVRFDSCTVVFDEIQTGVFTTQPSDNDIMRRRSTVRLGAISEVNLIKTTSHPFGEALTGKTLECDPAPAYQLFLVSASNGIGREVYMEIPEKSFPLEPPDRNTGFTWLRFGDESLAQRVAKAFQHAADLCRKEEPF